MGTIETRVGDVPAPAASNGMKVHAIQTGTVAVKTRQREGTGRGPMRLANTLIDRNWTDPLPIFAWLIEHPEGLIVVDTGETSHVADPGYFPRWQPYFKLAVREWVAPEDEIGPTLKALGFFPDDVRWVIMTHLHTDHAGGLSHFPNSEILVYRSEFENASGLMARRAGSCRAPLAPVVRTAFVRARPGAVRAFPSEPARDRGW